jgi:hypothetical protein
VLDAIAALAAWKLPPFGRDPMTSIRVRSEGSDRFRRGRVVTLPVIDGHRDTNDTACPGRHLYHHLPEIRERTAHLVAYYSRVHVLEPAVLTGEPALGQTLTVDPGRYAPEDASLRYVWLRNDVRIEDAGAASYVVRPEDAGARLSVRVIARKPGLKPARRRLWSTRRVIAPATVDVYTVARGDGRLRVDVHVGSAPGVVVPTGRVVVEVAGHRAVVGLKDGHGFARFGWSRPLKAGRYRVRARYLGDRAHDPATGRARARVRR